MPIYIEGLLWQKQLIGGAALSYDGVPSLFCGGRWCKGAAHSFYTGHFSKALFIPGLQGTASVKV